MVDLKSKHVSLSEQLNGGLELIKPKVDNGKHVSAIHNHTLSSSVEGSAINPSVDTTRNPDEDVGEQEDTSSQDEDSADDSEAEMYQARRKYRLPWELRKPGAEGIVAMGMNPTEFELVRHI